MAAGTKERLENDYTLRVTTEDVTSDIQSQSLIRLFNFKARQVTTILRDWLGDRTGNAVTAQLNIQNFGDIESQDEINEMREKLIKLGGHPPASETLPKAKVAGIGNAP